MNHDSSARSLITSRLRLVPSTPARIRAELEPQDRLGEILDAAFPADWPPEHHDVKTLRFWLSALSQPGAAGWWMYYVVLTETIRPTLVGAVGYKGPLLTAW